MDVFIQQTSVIHASRWVLVFFSPGHFLAPSYTVPVLWGPFGPPLFSTSPFKLSFPHYLATLIPPLSGTSLKERERRDTLDTDVSQCAIQHSLQLEITNLESGASSSPHWLTIASMDVDL